ncbi:hypothetical protein GOV12_08175 [Candidatus Pacearchaeota archaeon]|nr:hypothetical protein [Candidatus Pacearchaeota archaeon]
MVWILVIILITLWIIIGFLIYVRIKFPKSKLMMNKTSLMVFIIGLLISLVGAYFMYNGKILGDNTVGIARILGIVGILLIVLANVFNVIKRK